LLAREGGEAADERLLVLPLRDVVALQGQAGGGIQLVQQAGGLVECSVLQRLLPRTTETDAAVATLAASVAGHIRSCSRCRHGIVPLPTVLQGWHALDCASCLQLFPVYYEATHTDYPLAEMPDQELVWVSIHLGACPACREQWGVLVQLATAEEDGEV